MQYFEILTNEFTNLIDKFWYDCSLSMQYSYHGYIGDREWVDGKLIPSNYNKE